MSTPVTELDPRFSDPGASPTSWEGTRRALESAEMFWITTVRADGRPHMSPRWRLARRCRLHPDREPAR